jgi:hypothetical protein
VSLLYIVTLFSQLSPLPDFCLTLPQIQTDDASIGTRSESDGDEEPQSVILAPSTFGQFVRYHALMPGQLKKLTATIERIKRPGDLHGVHIGQV